MVTNLFTRLGAVGLSVIAGALIFGAVGGAVIIHRLEAPSHLTASSQRENGHQDNDDAKPAVKAKKSRHPSEGSPGHAAKSKSHADPSGQAEPRKDA